MLVYAISSDFSPFTVIESGLSSVSSFFHSMVHYFFHLKQFFGRFSSQYLVSMISYYCWYVGQKKTISWSPKGFENDCRTRFASIVFFYELTSPFSFLFSTISHVITNPSVTVFISSPRGTDYIIDLHSKTCAVTKHLTHQ